MTVAVPSSASLNHNNNADSDNDDVFMLNSTMGEKEIHFDDNHPTATHDDDDDMAELFSFGIGVAGDLDIGIASLQQEIAAAGSEHARRDSNDSHDSFMELLDAESSILLDMMTAPKNDGSTTNTADDNNKNPHHDNETIELLQWLDKSSTANREVDGTTEEIVFDGQASERLGQLHDPTVVEIPSPTPPAPTFDTLEDALQSHQSTTEQIRNLAQQSISKNGSLFNNDEDALQYRPELYCRMLYHGKTLDDTIKCSLADSFEQWQKDHQQRQQQSREGTTMTDNLDIVWIKQQAKLLASNIAATTRRPIEECEKDLTDILLYQYHNKGTNKQQSIAGQESNTLETAMSIDSDNQHDVFLPPVACAVLAANIPVTAASVVVSQMIPNYMPLLALMPSERWQAALLVHTEFYLLACYHIPLLVFHLDRYLPGWQWPQMKALLLDTNKENSTAGRNSSMKKGHVPPSWLMCHLAGECSINTVASSEQVSMMLDSHALLRLWDGILTSHNNDATRFFLTIAVLEQAADKLILLTGEELRNELQTIWTIPEKYFPADLNWKDSEWWIRAQSLQKQTPRSVLQRIQRSEDVAVQEALKQRRLKAEALIQAKLDAEAAAFRQAQELSARQARERLSRARLIAFYREHAPDKEANIEKIMTAYSGRLDLLDQKLKSKYGIGFNPALDPKPRIEEAGAGPTPEQKKLGANKFLATMNLGSVVRGGKATSQEASGEDDLYSLPKAKDQVSVTVAPDELLPILCWSKEATAARSHTNTLSETLRYWDNLKFYLVDSRTEEAAAEQGRFPTSLDLSPEVLMDPERIKQSEDRFESLRGACHIVVMGEGYSALPKLYNQKLSPKLEALMKEDEARTNNCALFFCKKGFPFVSVLEGGYAGALSWLHREGPKNHLFPSSVLVDFHPEGCLFGQLETLHNSTATEKAQRKMTKLLESSLVTMTKQAQRLEALSAASSTELTENPKQMNRQESSGVGKLGLRFTMFNKSETIDDDSNNNVDEAKKSSGMNPFGTRGGKKEETISEDNDDTIDSKNATSALDTSADNKPVNNPFKGLGVAFNNTMKSASTMAASANNNQTNANNSSHSKEGATMPNVLKRNPFARFQTSDDANNKKNQDGARSTFGGFKNFGKTTMARMQVQLNKGQNNSNNDDEGVIFGGTVVDVPPPRRISRNATTDS